jgi:hypothetical protein
MYISDMALVSRFRHIVLDEMVQSNRIDDPDYEERRSWGAFWQGSEEHERDSTTSKWEYFEFWHQQTLEFQDKLLTKAQDIARRLGVAVEIV